MKAWPIVLDGFLEIFVVWQVVLFGIVRCTPHFLLGLNLNLNLDLNLLLLLLLLQRSQVLGLPGFGAFGGLQLHFYIVAVFKSVAVFVAYRYKNAERLFGDAFERAFYGAAVGKTVAGAQLYVAALYNNVVGRVQANPAHFR